MLLCVNMSRAPLLWVIFYLKYSLIHDVFLVVASSVSSTTASIFSVVVVVIVANFVKLKEEENL